uniref:Diablo, IAP-binding mitochondrial protein b n=1 Tax=Hucho hucho TaxID=62062 RepID=A0A4W5M5Q3_9TELE
MYLSVTIEVCALQLCVFILGLTNIHCLCSYCRCTPLVYTPYVLARTIHTLVTLHKHYVASGSKLTPAEEESVWQVIVRQRQEVSDLREDCKRFESNWMMAINLSKLAAETAYNAGADQASVTAQTSLQVSQSHVDQIRQLSMEAEKNLKESKAEDSQRIKLPAAMEEEDIPEAYLRED